MYDGYKYKDRLLRCPCPFCGEEKRSLYVTKTIDKNIGYVTYQIMCGNCGSEPNFQVDTEYKAIDWWKTRLIKQSTLIFIGCFFISLPILFCHSYYPKSLIVNIIISFFFSYGVSSFLIDLLEIYKEKENL